LNSILWDGDDAVAGKKIVTYYCLKQGATSQYADSNGNWSNGGTFADHFAPLSHFNSLVNYYPIHGMSVNKGARVWVDGNGSLYLFPPYFSSSDENLSNSNYTKYSLKGVEWQIQNYQKLPQNAIALTSTDIRKFYRDILPDLGPYEYNATSSRDGGL